MFNTILSLPLFLFDISLKYVAFPSVACDVLVLAILPF